MIKKAKGEGKGKFFCMLHLYIWKLHTVFPRGGGLWLPNRMIIPMQKQIGKQGVSVA